MASGAKVRARALPFRRRRRADGAAAFPRGLISLAAHSASRNRLTPSTISPPPTLRLKTARHHLGVAQVTLRRLQEVNAGWSFRELTDGEDVVEPLAIRGYTILKTDRRELTFDEPGVYVVDDSRG